MNGNSNGRGPSPRDRYFAAQRQAAELERQRQAEAARLAAERAKQAEMERQKRIYEEKLRRKKAAEKKRRKERAKVFRTRLLLFSVMFLIILSITLLCIFISFNKTNGSILDGLDSTDYTFYFVTDDKNAETVKWTQTENETVVGNEIYVNFTKLSEILELTVTGDGDNKRYVTPNGEEVRFTYGEAVAVVNSESYRMTGKAKEYGSDKLTVPLSFVTEIMTGVTVEIDPEKPKITFSKAEDAVVAFILKPDETIETVKEEEEYGDTTEPPVTEAPDDPPESEIPEVEFKSDLSEYEEYMDPEDRDAYLVLVNSKNLLTENDNPTDLVEVVNTRADGRNKQKLRLYAAKALEALFIELYANGYDEKGPSGYPVSVMSAYRSYSYQSQLFNDYTNREMKDDPSLTREEAEKITETYSARPGTSEHQTGLCVDMHNLSSAQKAFAKEDAYEWLIENCWKFGFILRFPDGKTDITGITYEPWHYRYVGRYHAYKIMSEGLTLEEYLEGLE